MRTGLWALGCLAVLSAAAAFGTERTLGVRGFGAVGDGVHNDGPAIQKALDATERPLTVLIPDGVYVVGAALRVGSATTVRAASNAVVRLADDAGKDCHSFVIAVNLNRWRFPVGSGNIRHVLLEDFRVGKTDYTPWAPAHIDVGLRVQDVRIRKYVNTGPEGVVLAVNTGETNRIGTANGKVRTGASFSLPGGVIDDLRINGRTE